MKNFSNCDNKAIVSPSTAKLKCPLRKGGGIVQECAGFFGNDFWIAGDIFND